MPNGLGSAFKISTDNPVGRNQILKNLDRHNKFICDAAPYVNTHQSRQTIDHRELCRMRPSWLPTSYESFYAGQMRDVMERLIVKATACVDSSPPELAWHHRQLKNIHRKQKLADPVYWQTQGTEIQWSDQEAQKARAAFSQMNSAKRNAKKCISNELSETSIAYIEWKRQQKEKRLPVINIPMHPAGSPLNRPMHTGATKKDFPGSPTNRSDSTWSAPPDPNRDTAIGVPDAMGDKLKMATVKGDNKLQPLPPALEQRTVHNGWDKASNGTVRDQYLKTVGHCETVNDMQGVVADLGYLVEDNGGKVQVPSQPGSRAPSRQGSRIGTAGSRSSMRNTGPVYPTTSCMYSAEVLEARLTAPGSGELTVRKGETVFVLEDGFNRCFKVVNKDGSMGTVPCGILKFLQTVPPGRLQPAANGLGPADQSAMESLGQETTVVEPMSRPQSQMSSRPASRASKRVQIVD